MLMSIFIIAHYGTCKAGVDEDWIEQDATQARTGKAGPKTEVSLAQLACSNSY